MRSLRLTLPSLACFLLTLTGLLLGGCATKGSVVELQSEAAALRKDAQTNQLTLANRMRELEGDNARLRSELEQALAKLQAAHAEARNANQAAATKLAEVDAQLGELLAQRDNFKNYADFIAKLDKAVTTLATMEGNLNDGLSRLEQKDSNLDSALNALRSDTEKNFASTRAHLDDEDRKLSERLKTTDADLDTFRRKSRDQVAEIKEAFTLMGVAVYELLATQRNQVQDLGNKLTESINKLETQLPKERLAGLDPDELLKKSNGQQ